MLQLLAEQREQVADLGEALAARDLGGHMHAPGCSLTLSPGDRRVFQEGLHTSLVYLSKATVPEAALAEMRPMTLPWAC